MQQVLPDERNSRIVFHEPSVMNSQMLAAETLRSRVVEKQAPYPIRYAFAEGCASQERASMHIETFDGSCNGQR